MPVLQALETLKELEEENENDEVDDTEDELSWCKSEPKFDALPDFDSETDVSDLEPEAENHPAEEVLGKDGYLWQATPNNTKRTPRQNIVTGIPGSKGSGLAAHTTLKSFQLFFDDVMIAEIVTCTNQNIENVRTVYYSRSGFRGYTNKTEVRALLGILLFLSVKKVSKRMRQVFGPKMVLESQFALQRLAKDIFCFLPIAYVLMILP